MDEFSKKELEDYFCRFTFGQFVTLILLEIVTLFFVFYLGSRYGADILGSGGGRGEAVRVESPLPALPKEEMKGPEPVDTNYPELLSGPEATRSIRVKPSGVTVEEYEKRKKEIQELPVKELPVEVPVEVTREKEPVTRVEKETGRFAVQVGSYRSAEEASKVVNRWKGRGYSAFLAVGEVPDKGTWYRVRIGNFATRHEAEKYLKKLKGREKVSGLVVSSKSE